MNKINIAIFVITLALLLPLTTIVRLINRLRKDLSQINLTLDKIANEIGVVDKSIEDIRHIDNKLKKLVAKDKRIEAIKMYRNITGKGLKEAKEYINNLE